MSDKKHVISDSASSQKEEMEKSQINSSDPLIDDEIKQIEKDKQKALLNKIESINKDLDQYRRLRMVFAIGSGIFVCIWCVFVVFALVMSASYIWDNEIYQFMKIPESVLITLLSTTTVNILGLVIIINQGLFVQHKDR